MAKKAYTGAGSSQSREVVDKFDLMQKIVELVGAQRDRDSDMLISYLRKCIAREESTRTFSHHIRLNRQLKKVFARPTPELRESNTPDRDVLVSLSGFINHGDPADLSDDESAGLTFYESAD